MPDPNQSAWGSWAGQGNSGGGTTNSFGSFYNSLANSGIVPTPAALGTSFYGGLGNIFAAAGQERTTPGSTVLGDYTWGPHDLSNMDRIGSFYNAAYDNPMLTPVAMYAIPAYEAAKGIAMNMPGGTAIWNGVTNAAMAAGLPVGDFPIDATTSPASMSNVIAGMGGAAAGAADKLFGTTIGKPIEQPSPNTGMPNFSGVTSGASTTAGTAQSTPEFGSQVYGGYAGTTPPAQATAANTQFFTPPNSGPQQPSAFPGMATTVAPPPNYNIGTSQTSPDFNTPIPNPNPQYSGPGPIPSGITGTGPGGPDRPRNQLYENKITQFDSMNGMPYQVSPSAYYAGQADYNPSLYYDGMPAGAPDYWRGPQDMSMHATDANGNQYDAWGNLTWQNPNAPAAAAYLAAFNHNPTGGSWLGQP